MKESVAILCGGGPAPGINSVISSVAMVFLKSGYKVLGIHEGYKGLVRRLTQRFRKLTSQWQTIYISGAVLLCK